MGGTMPKTQTLSQEGKGDVSTVTQLLNLVRSDTHIDDFYCLTDSSLYLTSRLGQIYCQIVFDELILIGILSQKIRPETNLISEGSK